MLFRSNLKDIQGGNHWDDALQKSADPPLVRQRQTKGFKERLKNDGMMPSKFTAPSNEH